MNFLENITSDFELFLPEYIADLGDILAENVYFISTTIQFLEQHHNQTNMEKTTKQNPHIPHKSHKQPPELHLWSMKCHSIYTGRDRIFRVLMYMLVQSIYYDFCSLLHLSPWNARR